MVRSQSLPRLSPMYWLNFVSAERVIVSLFGGDCLYIASMVRPHLVRPLLDASPIDSSEEQILPRNLNTYGRRTTCSYIPGFGVGTSCFKAASEQRIQAWSASRQAETF